ncbi:MULTISPECIES: hypothetical protein [unclassified Bradyrhizobium]|uniref:hypothetical protein n=1 Tax=unclassified Bradyrhizobium TaxID=2631580 RepID=UPI003397A0BA
MDYMQEFSVEFTRLDENQTMAYQVVCQNDTDDAAAISRAEAQFKKEQPDAVLVVHEDIINPSKRSKMDRSKTWWRNKVYASHKVLV